MITTIWLINTYFTPSNQHLFSVASMVRTFKTYSLRHFQVYNTVLLTGVILAVRYIPRACLSCNLKVVPFYLFFHFTHPPTSGNLQCVLSISSFILLLFGVIFHI